MDDLLTRLTERSRNLLRGTCGADRDAKNIGMSLGEIRAIVSDVDKAAAEIRSLRARLDAAEGRVRIALWNDAKGRGLTDEAAYSLINEAIKAIRDGEKN